MTEHKTIYAALAAAQAEMGRAAKDAKNPHLKSKYADLASVMDACMPALSKHGIAVFQPPYHEGTERYVKTIFAHGDSGDMIECMVPLILQKNDMQGYGSAVTYARRYGLMCMSGIAPEDDDGHAAAKAAPKSDPKPAQQAEKPTAPDHAEIAKFKSGMMADINAAPDLERVTMIESHPKYKADLERLRGMDAEAASDVETRMDELKAKFAPQEEPQ